MRDSEERKFIHDISAPLAAAILLADAMLEETNSQSVANPDDVAQIKLLFDSLERMQTMLQERRRTLSESGTATSNG